MNFYRHIFKLSLIVVIVLFGCKSRNGPKEVDELALFTTTEIFDSISENYKLVPSVERLIAISKNQPFENKINALLDSISENNFNNLKIEIIKIDEAQDGYKSLKVNLKENPGFIIPDSLGNYRSWYDFFQGSMGGEQTSIILVESLLQRDYTGSWIDEVEFYYQNEKIGELDHVHLSEVFKRN